MFDLPRNACNAQPDSSGTVVIGRPQPPLPRTHCVRPCASNGWLQHSTHGNGMHDGTGERQRSLNKTVLERCTQLPTNKGGGKGNGAVGKEGRKALARACEHQGPEMEGSSGELAAVWRMAPAHIVGANCTRSFVICAAALGLDGAGALMKAKGDGRELPALAGRPPVEKMQNRWQEQGQQREKAAGGTGGGVAPQNNLCEWHRKCGQPEVAGAIQRGWLGRGARRFAGPTGLSPGYLGSSGPAGAASGWQALSRERSHGQRLTALPACGRRCGGSEHPPPPARCDK